MILTDEETYMLSAEAPAAQSMALRIVVETARLMGTNELVEISGAHVDSCIYFCDAGVHFAERLRDLGAEVTVPTTLNVGALDLIDPGIIRSDRHHREMSQRLMQACLDMGCQASWTCAPYQSVNRPALGDQIAWAESNAIVFANSVLGARTNRYGDYFDICAAITGRAPKSGLHLTENRRATTLVTLSDLPDKIFDDETFYPVLGTWLGRSVGAAVAAFDGMPNSVPEDWLKAMAAASASSGAVGLFHIIGVTPEAATMADAFQGRDPDLILTPTMSELTKVREQMSTAAVDKIDCVALGSPHFSLEECSEFAKQSAGRRYKVPVYVCTRLDVWRDLDRTGLRKTIEEAGATLVVGTCVVVTPILRQQKGVLMTNSGKFAHYSPSTVQHEVVFGSLSECLESAEKGKVVRDQTLWN